MVSFCCLTQLNAQNKTYEDTHKHKHLRHHIAKHQTIAIIPMEVTIIDKKYFKNKNSDPEVIEAKQKEFQTAFQSAFYKRLLWMKEKNKLKNINVQDISITNQLLFRDSIETMDDLIELKYSEIANILGVDAIFCGEAEITQSMDKGRSLVLNLLTDSNSNAENSNITLKLRNSEDGEVIWQMNHGVANSSLIWKTEKLIQMIFKERLSKDFPYHKKF